MTEKNRAQASYTVEASYIMAIVILSLALLIHTAYYRCKKETGIMRLHHVVEMARGQGDELETEFDSAGMTGYGERKKEEAAGRIGEDGWEKEISIKVHRPEAFMRMLTVFSGDGKGENDSGSRE